MSLHVLAYNLKRVIAIRKRIVTTAYRDLGKFA
jgi:hypothetical protein